MPAPIIFSEWRATAIVDYITIRFPVSKLKTPKDVSSLSWRGQGTVQCSKRLGLYHGHGCDWLTVHDPDREALQFLIDTFPTTEVIGLEVSVDLRPRSAKTSIAKLTQAHGWLTSALFPQHHPQMAGTTTRKRFDAADGKIKPIALKPSPGRTTVYWENHTAYEEVKLYVKKKDKHIKSVIPSTRVEITLNRGGCQMAGVTKLASLPAFAPLLRCYLSPFFDVVSGILPKIRRVRSKNPAKVMKAEHDAKKERERVERNWGKYGAQWAAKHNHKVIPDREANRMIGGALNDLRRDLKKLKLPR